MTSAFTVVINVAKLNLTATPPGSSYHVFVDPSQMGIVVEFMELVRYLYNLQDGIVLTHNHAHIHYLEDIRILNLFKYVEVEYFTPSPAEITRMKSLLEKLQFYDCSTGQNIPRIIFSRFEKNADTEKKIGELTYSNDLKSLENTFQERTDYNEIRQDSLKTNFQNELSNSALVQFRNQCSFETGRITFSNQPTSDLNNSSGALQKIQNSKNLNGECLDNITSKPAQTTPPKPKGKRPQNLRPFSLGAMLNALRSSSSQEDNSASQNPLDNTQNDLNKTNETELQDEEDSSINLIPCKKRKRVRRRSRKRKQNEIDSTPSNYNSNAENNTSYNSVKNVQMTSLSNGNHVRFDSESEEEGESSETGRYVNTTNEATGEGNTNEKTDEKLETEGVMCRLPWIKLDSSKGEDANLQNMDDESTLNNSIVTEFNKNLHNQMQDKSNSTQADPIRALLSFKKQNVSPVAYRNTQFNIMKGSPKIKQEEKSN